MDTRTPSADAPGRLFGKTRCAVLGLLFGHPDERFYLRQIARLTKVGLGALQRELQNLEAAGVLTRTRAANSVFFQANPASPIYPELLGLATKTMGAAEILRTAFGKLRAKIRVAFIYGSFASASHDARSDIDVFVIGDASTRDVMARLLAARQSLRREVSPVVMSPVEFRRRVADRSTVLQSVLRGPRVYLVGGDREFGELGGGRVGKTRAGQSGSDPATAGEW